MHQALRWHRAGFAEARALDSGWFYRGGGSDSNKIRRIAVGDRTVHLINAVLPICEQKFDRSTRW